MKPLLYVSFVLISVLLGRETAVAKTVTGDSALCKNRNLITMIAVSAEDHDIAICKEFGDAYHYVSQSKQDKTQKLFLPIVERNNPYRGANPWLLKARNGSYTYQVAEFNPLSKRSYVSASIFKNGQRIYYQVIRSYIRADE
ncbi:MULTISPECIES: hypothetical protein [Leptolyngbya]|uniref:hypothetical protein n=1 Tax=Leptolyngbya TaxID=47251 RepID=UPI001685CAD0|nr:hypothetical protein [Leptolyngbya sp. FACHB-1624]MBD1859989.1 hypothetical protein [Leptolyngbya sp. FACHB-1624]